VALYDYIGPRKAGISQLLLMIEACGHGSDQEGMMVPTLIMLMLIVLAIAANRWGVHSMDGPDSPEWERRQRWYGFH